MLARTPDRRRQILLVLPSLVGWAPYLLFVPAGCEIWQTGARKRYLAPLTSDLARAARALTGLGSRPSEAARCDHDPQAPHGVYAGCCAHRSGPNTS